MIKKPAPKPFYDPTLSYEANAKKGPFGSFSDKKVYKESGKPKESFLGLPVFTPFGIPAGPLVNGKFVQAALNKGFDICVYKTVRSSAYPCHPWPNVLPVKVGGKLLPNQTITTKKNYTKPLSITNSFGVPSRDPAFWQKDLAKLVKKTKSGQIVVGSFQGTKKENGTVEEYINDFVKTARLMLKTGVKVMEINLSCPNEGTNNLLCFDTDRCAAIAKAIKKVIGKTPLVVKVAYFPDQKALENFVKKVGVTVDAISAINTIPSSVIDSQKQPALGKNRLVSGVCGDAIRWAGLEMVLRLDKLRKKLKMNYSIIGVGGVMTTSNYQEFRKAGADAVMSSTGAMWNPNLAQEIKILKN